MLYTDHIQHIKEAWQADQECGTGFGLGTGWPMLLEIPFIDRLLYGAVCETINGMEKVTNAHEVIHKRNRSVRMSTRK